MDLLLKVDERGHDQVVRAKVEALGYKNKESKIAHLLCTECCNGKRLEHSTTSTRSIPGGSSFRRMIKSEEVPLDKIRTMSL